MAVFQNNRVKNIRNQKNRLSHGPIAFCYNPTLHQNNEIILVMIHRKFLIIFVNNKILLSLSS